MVTDEGENGKVQGNSFAKLYKKYITEVYAGAKLVFVELFVLLCKFMIGELLA